VPVEPDGTEIAMVLSSTSAVRCVLVVVPAVCCAAPLFAQCRYDVTIIQGPTHPIYGPPAMIPTGLNNLGHVVAYYFYIGEDERGFRWTPEGGFQTLPMPPDATSFTPFDINDAGVIVGEADVPSLAGYRGFMYENGSYTYLKPVPNTISSAAYAVNNAGLVVGMCNDPPAPPCTGDVDGNGNCGLADLAILLSEFGVNCE
jgi:uncharacterized membrane protein